MINKSSLWFITLSSIILVLAVYYIALPSESLSTVIKSTNNNEEVLLEIENEKLTSYRVMKETDDEDAIIELQTILLDDKSNINEKNDAYEKIKNKKDEQVLENNIEKILKDTYKINVFVNIDNSAIKVVVDDKTLDYTMANNIINKVNEYTNNSYYVTVKFE